MMMFETKVAIACRLFVLQFEPRVVQPPSRWRLALATFIVWTEWFLLQSVWSTFFWLAVILTPMWTEYRHWSVWVDSARDLRWKVLNRRPLEPVDFATHAHLSNLLLDEPENRPDGVWWWRRDVSHLELEAVADASNVKACL